MFFRSSSIRSFEQGLLFTGALLFAASAAVFTWGALVQRGVLDRVIPAVTSPPSPLIAGAASDTVAATRDPSGGWIDIPRLSIHAPLEPSTGFVDLIQGVGHVEGTALPGEDGNAVLAGHRDGWFRELGNVALGDTVIVTMQSGRFVYRVHTLDIVEPTSVDVLEPTDLPELTLITCYPFRYVGPAPQRFIVKAALVSCIELEMCGTPSSGKGIGHFVGHTIEETA